MYLQLWWFRQRLLARDCVYADLQTAFSLRLMKYYARGKGTFLTIHFCFRFAFLFYRLTFYVEYFYLFYIETSELRCLYVCCISTSLINSGPVIYILKHKSAIWMFICIEAIPSCLLLNKPHLFSITQHRFILIQFVTLTCVTCFGLYWDHLQGGQYKKSYKEKLHLIFSSLKNIDFYFNP